MSDLHDDLWGYFCGEKSRYSLESPFVRDGWKIACDGAILLCEPTDEPDTEGRKTPDASEFIEYAKNAVCDMPFEVGEIPSCPKCNDTFVAKSTDCPECGGSGHCDECNGIGEVTCYACDHDHDCDECGGTGDCSECDGSGDAQEYEDDCECTHSRGDFLLPNGAIIGWKYAKMMRKIGVTKVKSVDIHDKIAFTNEQGQIGIVMPKAKASYE